MVHQALVERGVSAAHEDEPWRQEIMRLHFQITGKRIWLAPEIVGKERDEDGRRAVDSRGRIAKSG